MATHTRTYRTCDGCGASELDGAVFEYNCAKYPNFASIEDYIPPTIDICQDCVEDEKYFCKLCHEVHDDAHPCDFMRHEIEATDRYIRAMTPADDEIPF